MVNSFHLISGVNLSAVSSPVKPRPVGHHHGDLRNALLRATLELVGERGPHGFTLAETSRRAGVSVAAPYKHFADRESLLASGEQVPTAEELGAQFEQFLAEQHGRENPDI